RRSLSGRVSGRIPLPNDLGGLEQHLLGDGEAEGVGRQEVDCKLEGGRLLDGQVGRFGAFEDAVYVVGGAPERRSRTSVIGHEPPVGHPIATGIHPRQAAPCRELYYPSLTGSDRSLLQNKQRVDLR